MTSSSCWSEVLGDGQGYEYRLLAASSGTSFPQTEVTQARGDGCVIAGLVSRGAGTVALDSYETTPVLLEAVTREPPPYGA